MYVLPAIEIIDLRVQDWTIELPDTLSDRGGSVILGGMPRRVTHGGLDLSNTRDALRFGKSVSGVWSMGLGLRRGRLFCFAGVLCCLQVVRSVLLSGGGLGFDVK